MSPDIDPKPEKAGFIPVDGSQEENSDLIEEHEEEISQNGQKFRRKGIYLLPNLLTTGALFAGFYAIIAGMGGDFSSACAAIVVAMFFDGMDGRVARLTNTQSAFGAEFDSLSDMVAFGVAPALICFSWALSGLGKIGWTVAFVYVACAALRLARFNVQRAGADKRFFVGLASPSAAGLVVFMVWAFSSYGVDVTWLMSIMAALVTGLAGVLMVINVRYYSFKELDFKNPVPFFLTLVIVFVIVVVSWHPPTMLFLMAVSYALSGPLMAIYLRRKKKSAELPVSPITTDKH